MRIIIADDHAIVCRGLEILLNYQSDIEVVGTAADGQEAYRLVETLHPDVALLDISMPPGESGLITSGRIHNDFPDTKVIIITMYDDAEYLLYTVQAGASGYLLKNAPEAELLTALRTVHSGGVYISKEMLPYLVQGFVQKNKDDCDRYLQLSDREVEVLTMLAKGYGNKEIGDIIHLSVKTVEGYRAKIMSKLGLKTKPELVEYALKKKLLQF